MKPSKVRKASLPGTASTAVADIEEDEEVEDEKVNFFSDRIQMRKNSRMLQILNRKNKNRIIDLFLLTHAFRSNKK